MEQQQLHSEGSNREEQTVSAQVYEGDNYNNHMEGQKLSVREALFPPPMAQRVALAIASFVVGIIIIFVVMILGNYYVTVGPSQGRGSYASLDNLIMPNLIFIVLCITFLLYSIVALVINIRFNRRR
jgi:hypothetical protein